MWNKGPKRQWKAGNLSDRSTASGSTSAVGVPRQAGHFAKRSQRVWGGVWPNKPNAQMGVFGKTKPTIGGCLLAKRSQQAEPNVLAKRSQRSGRRCLAKRSRRSANAF